MKLVNTHLDPDPQTVRTEWSTSADCGHLYWALTEGLSDWLGTASSMSMALEPGATFCFEARHEWGGGTHYGRFVELRRNRRIVMKWISETLGGVEADVAIDLVATDLGTDVRVDHIGITESGVRASVERLWLGARHALDTLILSAQQPTD